MSILIVFIIVMNMSLIIDIIQADAFHIYFEPTISFTIVYISVIAFCCFYQFSNTPVQPFIHILI